MPLFKITPYGGMIKKAVVASNFEEFVKSACTKLEKTANDGIKIVLQSDGTEIDDWEVLSLFSGEVIMILDENEHFKPKTMEYGTIVLQDVIVSPPQRYLNASNGNDTSLISSNLRTFDSDQNASNSAFITNESGEDTYTDSNDTATVDNIPDENSNELQQSPPQPQIKITLPKFSDYVESRLVEGKPMAMFSELVAQLAYGLVHKHKMSTAAEYNTVGQMMFKKYPCINVNKTSKSPYRYLINKLSQKIRNIRWLEKKRMSESMDGASNRKRKAESSASTSYNVNLAKSDSSYEEALDQLKAEFAVLDKDIPKLLKIHRMTFSKRRQLITNGDCSFDEIMKTFPQLSQYQFLESELQLIVNQDDVKYKFLKNLTLLYNLLEEHIYKGQEDNVDDFCQTLNFIIFLENKLKTGSRSKSKGKKNQSVKQGKNKNNFSMINILEEGPAVSTLTDAPQLVVIQNESKVFILYKGFEVECPLPLSNCIFDLFAYYYTFDLSYPGVLQQSLGFIQEFCLRDFSPNSTFVKSFNYLKFVEDNSLDNLFP